MPAASKINAHDRALLAKAAAEAGELAKKHFDLGDPDVWEKSDSSPVTNADIAVNAFLLGYLRGARPDYGWLSEETKDDGSRRKKQRVFVVDPIDGTRAFIKRKPHFVISVAVLDEGKPVAGALYNPLTGEAFDADLYGGATLNGKTIAVEDCAQIKGCRMVGYDYKFKALNWPDMDVRARNSMAYRIALVAAGIANAAVAFTPKSDWDLAAACLIAREAGAHVTDIYGHDFEFNAASTENKGVICAGPTLHPLLLNMIDTHGVKKGGIKLPPSPRG